MSIQCRVLVNELERLAPKHLAEDWDNVGLQVGGLNESIDRVMVALDVTEQVVDEAIQQKVNFLIAHHPLVFKPMKKVVEEDQQGRIIRKLIKHDIGLYCAHTNLDIAEGGVNDVLARKLGLEQCRILAQTQEEGYYKLVVFVPEGHEERVREAICGQGAGYIGAYSHCTYQGKGTGTFLAHEGCHPFLGQVGEIEYANEYRLETIVPKEKLSAVLQAMNASHPYEEVAYDLYPLENKGRSYGLGRVGKLTQEMNLGQFINYVGQRLGINQLNYVGEINRPIKKVAVCGGSGSSFITAAAGQGADVYVTGDVKYHEGQLAEQMGIALIDAGHFATEQPVVPALAEYLSKTIDGIEVITSQVESNVIKSIAFNN